MERKCRPDIRAMQVTKNKRNTRTILAVILKNRNLQPRFVTAAVILSDGFSTRVRRAVQKSCLQFKQGSAILAVQSGFQSQFRFCVLVKKQSWY